MNYDMTRNLLTEQQAAEYLGGLTPKALQAWRVRGGGPPFLKIGRLIRYRESDLHSWLESRIRTSTSEMRQVAGR